MGMFSLSDVQAAIREQGVDGWLLYDFRKSNVLAERVLGLDKKNQPSLGLFYPPGGNASKTGASHRNGCARCITWRQKDLSEVE